ncbi:hypothetical protein PISL3812_02975 [Talaromyces islandicus]|uniref:Alpha/beta hydrolase fold-3 domain-containing protein n=1 Tax=Talaromyces islandicus TaxID=28573 RepID=A0A0U1LS49_TALIS|nr:hypothetical protein PISL3812_02975 [Talaromyces islandicus]
MATLVPGASLGQKFTNFDILQSTYKIVDGHEIRADILIPRSLPAGKAPVIARFHGGGLVRGDSIYEDWFPVWLLDLAEEHGAVIASANYRFLPEATGLDILDDVDDFWIWLHSSTIAQTLSSHVELDLNRIITAGDSAGGLLSVYLALSQPDQIRAATAAYPALHWDTPSLLPTKPSPILKNAPDNSFIDEYISSLKPGHIESSDLGLKRIAISSAITANRRGAEFYTRGADAVLRRGRLYQLLRLDNPDSRLPPGGLVILHGVDDDLVPIGASERFVDKSRDILKGRQGADRVVFSQRPGGHGFDVNSRLSEQWLKDALEVAVDTWLG